ncbi:MAG: hypothetical protein V1735_04245 [Nanoarchaeota archaeon]
MKHLGKSATVEALLAAGYGAPNSEIPIPKSLFLHHGDDAPALKDDFSRMRKPTIVRGSDALGNDAHGLIDVLPTFYAVSTWEQLLDAVRLIKEIAASEGVKAHTLDWGQTYSPDVDILIQEQSPSLIK